MVSILLPGLGLQEQVDNAIIKCENEISIPASGSTGSYDLTGLTADHEVMRWNFSSSAENCPPCSLTITTYAGYFTITNNGGTTSEKVKPVFALPTMRIPGLHT